MGAEVIKIEPVVSGEFTRSLPHLKNEVSGFFLHMNSGKKSISVDLKQPKGLAILKELAAVYDVIIQNHKTGFHERIGLPYEKLAGNNPPSRFQFDIQHAGRRRDFRVVRGPGDVRFNILGCLGH